MLLGQIGDRGATFLAAALLMYGACPLRKLGLAHCGLGAAGVRALAGALYANESLVEVRNHHKQQHNTPNTLLDKPQHTTYQSALLFDSPRGLADAASSRG